MAQLRARFDEMESPLQRHASACRGHPRLSRMPSAKDVDGRDKPGHDAA